MTEHATEPRQAEPLQELGKRPLYKGWIKRPHAKEEALARMARVAQHGGCFNG